MSEPAGVVHGEAVIGFAGSFDGFAYWSRTFDGLGVNMGDLS